MLIRSYKEMSPQCHQPFNLVGEPTPHLYIRIRVLVLLIHSLTTESIGSCPSPLNITSPRFHPPHLPSEVSIVGVADEETLGGEGVRLYFDVGASDLVDERGFAHVGKSRDQDGASIRVDRRQTGQVLTDLVRGGRNRVCWLRRKTSLGRICILWISLLEFTLCDYAIYISLSNQ